jgi:hypothetical protein
MMVNPCKVQVLVGQVAQTLQSLFNRDRALRYAFQKRP